LIGLPETPAILSADRLFLSGGDELWQGQWYEGDNTIRSWLNLAKSRFGFSLKRFKTFRSNLSEISICHTKEYNFLAWDERFFDHILQCLISFSSNHSSDGQFYLERSMLKYAGELYLKSHPHHSLSIFEYSRIAFGGNAGAVTFPSSIPQGFVQIFQMMRHFALAHEIGHLLVDDPFYRSDLEGFVAKAERFLQVAANNISYGNDFLGAKSYANFINDMIKESADSHFRSELMADIFGVISIVDWGAEGTMSGGIGRPYAPEEVLVCAYDALYILYIITGCLKRVAEWLNPKALARDWDRQILRPMSPAVTGLAYRAELRRRLVLDEALLRLNNEQRSLFDSANYIWPLVYKGQMNCLEGIDVIVNRDYIHARSMQIKSSLSYNQALDRAMELYGFL
jgi:hypothetical protein